MVRVLIQPNDISVTRYILHLNSNIWPAKALGNIDLLDVTPRENRGKSCTPCYSLVGSWIYCVPA